VFYLGDIHDRASRNETIEVLTVYFTKRRRFKYIRGRSINIKKRIHDSGGTEVLAVRVGAQA